MKMGAMAHDLAKVGVASSLVSRSKFNKSRALGNDRDRYPSGRALRQAQRPNCMPVPADGERVSLHESRCPTAPCLTPRRRTTAASPYFPQRQ
jgi:hypothetical protein